MNDSEFVNSIIEKFGLSEDPMIFYTDGSKSDDSLSTGVGIVVEDRDIAYNINLPKKCSSFTAETFAIKDMLDMLDIICNTTFFIAKDVIFFDCQAVIFAIENNHINVYYILRICI